MNNLAEFISKNTRSDDYVNATEWCRKYGRKWSEYRGERFNFLRAVNKRLNSSKDSLNSLSDKDLNSSKGYYAESKGKNAVTFVHPLVAIDLAEWLDPDFAVTVKETFARYLKGDVTLAAEIAERNENPKDIDWLIARLEGKKARRSFTDELKQCQVTGSGYGANTNAIYEGLFNCDANGLKAKLQVKNLRDGMDDLQLTAIKLAELAAIKRMRKYEAFGNTATVVQSKAAASKVKEVLDDCG